jgi:branched-chain amino acid transport system ATP-binding protein
MDPLLAIDRLSVSYGGIRAVSDASLIVNPGEIVTLLGPNGGGKSTLLRALTGLVRSTGSITFGGERIDRRATEDIAALGIAMVPEGRGVLAGLTVSENLEMGAYVSRPSKSEVLARMGSVTALFPILAEKLTQNASELSGGQKQMLLIARCLMSRPLLMVLDEPSLGLAPLVVRSVFDTLSHLTRSQGLTVLVAEQNARAALRVAGRGYLLDRGRIVLDGTAEELSSSTLLESTYLGGPNASSDRSA